MSILALIPSPAARRRIAILFVTAVALVGVGTTSADRAQAGGMGCSVDPDWGTMRATWADEVVTLTNAHRETLGLRPLTPSDSLTRAAEWKAAHMANFGYMSHDDPAPPLDRSWDQRIEDCGYTWGMGENIAYGYRSPAAVVAGWLGSTGHRENIENPDFRVIGLGAAANGAGTVYWAQTFGTRLETSDVPADVDPEPEQAADAPTILPDDTASETKPVNWIRMRTLSSGRRLARCYGRRSCRL